MTKSIAKEHIILFFLNGIAKANGKNLDGMSQLDVWSHIQDSSSTKIMKLKFQFQDMIKPKYKKQTQ